MDIIESISKTVIKASTSISKDRKQALKSAIKKETNENAKWALKEMSKNFDVAKDTKFPLCDDTGIPHVIIELGSKREVTGELVNQINEGIRLGLNNLPGRPMAVKGNEKDRLSQSVGLFDEPGMMRSAPFLIDSNNDFSTYKRDISSDTLNIHILLEGGGPEIRAKTLRVFHKRDYKNVINTAISWLEDSLKMLGCTPSIPSVGIGRTHYEASSLMLKTIAYGNLDCQSDLEEYATEKLNETGIGPMGFGGKTTVLGSFINIGNQRASGVRIVSIRPSCFVEPRVASLTL